MELQGSVLYLSEEFCKGSFSQVAHLYRRLSFDLSVSPPLLRVWSFILSEPVVSRLPRLLFQFLIPRQRRLQAVLDIVSSEVA